MPLKRKDLDKFKAILETMHKQLAHSLESNAQQVKQPDEATGYSQHQADEGTDDFDRTINIEVTGKELKILKQIERALDKMEEETYGTCDISGEEIPLARLEAIPYATMTVKSQEKFEKGVI
ncbi:MAG: RNA polymerase-binding transcription factor DksA [Chlamydiae bacterium]|nr:RNA polymerase-binding transcription factor DksA [Chlamydiota bacterium]